MITYQGKSFIYWHPWLQNLQLSRKTHMGKNADKRPRGFLPSSPVDLGVHVALRACSEPPSFTPDTDVPTGPPLKLSCVRANQFASGRLAAPFALMCTAGLTQLARQHIHQEPFKAEVSFFASHALLRACKLLRVGTWLAVPLALVLRWLTGLARDDSVVPFDPLRGLLPVRGSRGAIRRSPSRSHERERRGTASYGSNPLPPQALLQDDMPLLRVTELQKLLDGSLPSIIIAHNLDNVLRNRLSLFVQRPLSWSLAPMAFLPSSPRVC